MPSRGGDREPAMRNLHALPPKQRQVLDSLGFDILRQRQDQQQQHISPQIAGVGSVLVSAIAPATAVAIARWEDKNYPYVLPQDLRAFLDFSNGLVVRWTSKLRDKASAYVGELRFPGLADLNRLPLDDDDEEKDDSDEASGGGHVAGSRRPALSRCSAASPGVARLEPVAAFGIDVSEDVGNVVLIYGKSDEEASISGGAPKGVSSEGADGKGGGGGGSGSSASGSSPLCTQVWFKDLGCRWHLLADSFTSYFRMAMVHLGVRGWQHAYTPMGLSPTTQQWMRLYCPDRLLFDQMEWTKERACREKERKELESATAAAIGGKSSDSEEDEDTSDYSSDDDDDDDSEEDDEENFVSSDGEGAGGRSDEDDGDSGSGAIDGNHLSDTGSSIESGGKV